MNLKQLVFFPVRDRFSLKPYHLTVLSDHYIVHSVSIIFNYRGMIVDDAMFTNVDAMMETKMTGGLAFRAFAKAHRYENRIVSDATGR